MDLTHEITTITIIDDDNVTIGWDSLVYMSDESGNVSACAVISGGEIARPVTVFYSTLGVTAQGNQHILYGLIIVCYI